MTNDAKPNISQDEWQYLLERTGLSPEALAKALLDVEGTRRSSRIAAAAARAEYQQTGAQQ